MSRLPLLTDTPADPMVKAMFDEVRARGIRVPNLYKTIGHAPKMLRAWLDFAWPLRLDAKTSRATRELLILRGAQVSGADYEWVHHVDMALAAGISPAKIDAIADWKNSPLFTPAEKAVIRLAEEVTQGPGASAECIDGLRDTGFDQEAIVELTLTASFYVCVARFLLSMDVPLEEGHS